MNEAERADLKARIREVWQAIPAQDVRDGKRVDFGPPGNKARAIYLAGRIGYTFNPDCKSCESDLWHVIRMQAR